MAPLAGLAAGLGLASLAGRLGLGAALAPVLMLVLFGAAATALVVALASRRYRTSSGAGLADAWQGIGGPSYAPRPKTLRITEPREPTLRPGGSPLSDGPRLAVRAPFGVPDDFDTPAFLASAKRSFVRLQSAWDRADLNELGECATDEMFNALTHELRVRAGPSRTDILTLEANLLGIESGRGDHLASVRFSGILRVNDEDERLDEVWNLSRPADGSGGWLLAGIQQLN
jgi:predicted lipid-binding transport protein (Tim44 family)